MHKLNFNISLDSPKTRFNKTIKTGDILIEKMKKQQIKARDYSPSAINLNKTDFKEKLRSDWQNNLTLLNEIKDNSADLCKTVSKFYETENEEGFSKVDNIIEYYNKFKNEGIGHGKNRYRTMWRDDIKTLKEYINNLEKTCKGTNSCFYKEQSMVDENLLVTKQEVKKIQSQIINICDKIQELHNKPGVLFPGGDHKEVTYPILESEKKEASILFDQVNKLMNNEPHIFSQEERINTLITSRLPQIAHFYRTNTAVEGQIIYSEDKARDIVSRMSIEEKIHLNNKMVEDIIDKYEIIGFSRVKQKINPEMKAHEAQNYLVAHPEERESLQKLFNESPELISTKNIITEAKKQFIILE